MNGEKVEHLDITGLTFRFTPPMWDITSAPWDFSTTPWGFRPEMHPGCVRVWGSGRDIRIANCRFEHVFFPIRIRSILEGQRVDDVRIEDNEFRYTDNGILSVEDGSGWGYADLRGRLGDVRIYRNHSLETGRRPARYSTGTGINVTGARTVEIAGNVIERSYAQGIDVHGAKASGDVGRRAVHAHAHPPQQGLGVDAQLQRLRRHRDLAGRPGYVFDNLSYNAQGYRNWERYSRHGRGLRPCLLPGRRVQELPLQQHRLGQIQGSGQPSWRTAPPSRRSSVTRTPSSTTRSTTSHEGSRRQAPDGRPEQVPRQHLGRHGPSTSSATPTRPGPKRRATPRTPGRGRATLPSKPTPTAATSSTTSPRWACWSLPGRWLLTFDDFKSTLTEEPGACSASWAKSARPRRFATPPGATSARSDGSAGIGQGRQGVCAVGALAVWWASGTSIPRATTPPISSTSTGT